MPLFGNSHNDTTTQGRHHDQATRTDGTTGFSGHTATGTGPGTAATGYMSAPGTGAGAGPIGSGTNNTGFNNDNNHHHGGVGTGQGVNDPYTSTTGTGAGFGSSNIPAANNMSQGRNGGHQDGAGKRMSGKVEHAVGSIIGSSALKAKGLQKEQEANSMKLQSQEIGEAERLEAEARTRRERAVAHGASPEHQTLGGSTRY